MYTLNELDLSKIPKPTKFLQLRVMCGACRYKCCNSPSFVVQCTTEEQKRLDLPEEFPQQGSCPCLTDTGCAHGDGRPLFCKFFPLQIHTVKQEPSLVIMHWCILHCPAPNDYILTGTKNGKYTYSIKDGVSRGKAKNVQPILILDKPLEEAFPNVLDSCGYALDALYGYGVTEIIKKRMAKPVGFGLGSM